MTWIARIDELRAQVARFRKLLERVEDIHTTGDTNENIADVVRDITLALNEIRPERT